MHLLLSRKIAVAQGKTVVKLHIVNIIHLFVSNHGFVTYYRIFLQSEDTQPAEQIEIERGIQEGHPVQGRQLFAREIENPIREEIGRQRGRPRGGRGNRRGTGLPRPIHHYGLRSRGPIPEAALQ